MNNRLNVNAAVFRIKKKNDYENQGTTAAPIYVGIGTSQVEGFEIGATGKLTEQWSVSGGYAYLKSELLDTLTAANKGHELAFTPKNSFSLWSTYDITPQLTIGGGAFYVDSRWTGVANDARIPDYWRFDAMAAYKVTRNLTMQLNVYNLDRRILLRIRRRRRLRRARRRPLRLGVGKGVVLRRVLDQVCRPADAFEQRLHLSPLAGRGRPGDA